MDKIEEQLKKFQKIDITDIFKKSVVETKESLLGHIRMQNWSGVASDGGILGTYKDYLATEGSTGSEALQYRDLKSQYVANYNAPYGQYNLYLSGDFHDAMFIQFDLDGNIIVDSLDFKTALLEYYVTENRGKDGGTLIFTLTKENAAIYAKQILPYIMERVRKELGY